MNIRCFLVVNSKGAVKALKFKPVLEANEVAVGVNLEIPDSAFSRPLLETSIKFTESDLSAFSCEIDTEKKESEWMGM